VNNVLKRRNLNRLPTFKEEKETIRYEKKKPFEIVHRICSRRLQITEE